MTVVIVSHPKYLIKTPKITCLCVLKTKQNQTKQTESNKTKIQTSISQANQKSTYICSIYKYVHVKSTFDSNPAYNFYFLYSITNKKEKSLTTSHRPKACRCLSIT